MTITSVPGAPPYERQRPTLALAANTGTLVEGQNTILMDIGSNINIIGLQTAQNFERTIVRHGLSIKKSRINPALFVSGVGSGAAVCNTTGEFPIGVQYRRGPAGNPASSAGQPATPDLEIFTAAIAEGSGENLPAIMGRRQMSEERGIIILENGKEKYIIVKDANYKIMLGKGAKVVNLLHSPSGHLVMKADDFRDAKVKTGERAYTLHASKGEPHLTKLLFFIISGESVVFVVMSSSSSLSSSSSSSSSFPPRRRRCYPHRRRRRFLGGREEGGGREGKKHRRFFAKRPRLRAWSPGPAKPQQAPRLLPWSPGAAEWGEVRW